MFTQHKTLILTSIGIVALVAGLSVALAMSKDERAGGSTEALAAFATCLADSGATFYGAFWCPHCQDQKADFGAARDAVPYVECATLSGGGQAQECTDAGITSYPTWVFADGERLSGRQPFAVLAEKTGCTAPTDAGTPPVAAPEVSPVPEVPAREEDVPASAEPVAQEVLPTEQTEGVVDEAALESVMPQ